MVKRRTGGYDGRGQWIITESNQRDVQTIYLVKLSQKNSFLFDYEVSIVGARFKMVAKRFYPVTHNLQQNGILRYSVTDTHSHNKKTNKFRLNLC